MVKKLEEERQDENTDEAPTVSEIDPQLLEDSDPIESSTTVSF